MTGDADFYFSTGSGDVERMFEALEDFWGGGVPGIDGSSDLSPSGVIVQFGVPPNRIDLINRIDGVSFDEAWEGRVEATLDLGGKEIPVFYIGIDDLLVNKERTPR